MSDPSARTDRRGLSEAVALAVLVGMVVLTTSAVGIYVLVTDTDGDDTFTVNFTYQHFEDSGTLLITHDEGPPVDAGELLIEGPANEVTWAEVGNMAESTNVTSGDSVQLSNGNAYGSAVFARDRVDIYRIEGGNRTHLSNWTGA